MTRTFVSVRKVTPLHTVRNWVFSTMGRRLCVVFAVMYIGLVVATSYTGGLVRDAQVTISKLRTEITGMETQYYTLSRDISTEDFSLAQMTVPGEGDIVYLSIQTDTQSPFVARR